MIPGKGVWLAAITVLESSLASLSYGWLWGGLFFVFITLGRIREVAKKNKSSSTGGQATKASTLALELVTIGTFLLVFRV